MVGGGLFFIYFYKTNTVFVMVTFIGDFVCKSDSKGRIVLPALFKKAMSAGEQQCFVVRKDLFEDCLVMVPYDAWLEEVKLLEDKLSSYRQKDRRLKRALYKSTAEINLDANGRFLIPKRLMEMINVKGEVVLLGVGSNIELWSKQRFEEEDMQGEELGYLAEDLLGSAMVED